jgi:hypothetical protein
MVGTECVTKNIDGTRTAYLSYNNVTGAEQSFGTNSTLGTINEFRVGTTSATPPAIFKVGQSKGTVVVPYTGGTLVWAVKAPKSLLSQATASDQSPACPEVLPVADCREYESGVLKVTLGYKNTGSFAQSFPIGKLNNFSPGAVDRGQPNQFFAGLNSAVFKIPLVDPNERVIWSINGQMVQIDNSLKTCAGGCVDTPLATTKGELDRVALALSGIMDKSWQVLIGVKDKKGGNGASQKARDRTDAARSKRKSAEYASIAQSLLIQVPAVVRICSGAAAYCSTVDRYGTIEALRGLYANQVNSIKRIMARVAFRSTGATSRRWKLVKQAKALEQEGLAQLANLPRFATECK